MQPTHRASRVARKILWLLILSVLSLSALSAASPPPPQRTIPQSIASILGTTTEPKTLFVACQKIHAGRDLIGFYQSREFRPIWVNDHGPTGTAHQLMEVLRETPAHGLNPEDYHISCLQSLFQTTDEARRHRRPLSSRLLASMDVILTDAFMILCSHLSTGRVDPEQLYPQWLSVRDKADILQGLQEVVRLGDVRRTVRRFAPPHDAYWNLVAMVPRLREVIQKGGWPSLPAGPSIHPGESDPRIPLLRARLNLSGDYTAAVETNAAIYDEELERAVRRFQSRHGLEVDGVVGKRTREALNVSARDRLVQLLANLERWRWLPRRWGDRYILVNTADYSLTAYQNGKAQLSMRVIVGKNVTKTPVFSEKMRYLEINPYWNVPRSIAIKEILPKIRKDPGYLARNHYELVSGWNDDGHILDPFQIDWTRIGARNFPGRLRQTPGPWNALGRIKFMFPNRFNVYLHDTPHRHLFRKPRRALSHGCIRIEKPLELALFVLQDDPSWTRSRIEKIIATGKRHVISLPRPCLVHLLYLTAWADKDGVLHFRKDIYDRDRVLIEALKLKKLVELITNIEPAPRPHE